MHRFFSVFPVLLLLSAALAAPQLLLNAGFESGSSGWVWNNSGTAAFKNDPPNAHSGSWYAKITSTGAAGSIPNLSASNSSGNQFFPVSPGDVIAWGGWVYRVSGNGYARWKLAAYDTNKANPNYLNPTPDDASTIGMWTQQAGTYTVPTGKAYVRLYAEIYGATVPSDVRLDDATLTDTPASAATLTSISVTPSNSTLPKGATQQFTATGTYSNGTSSNITTSVTWSSGNTAVATVSNTSGSQGVVSAVGVGSTAITATSGTVTGSTGLKVSTTSGNATVTIDFNARVGGAVIPPSIIGAQLGYANNPGLTLLQKANYQVMRIDAKLSTVFAGGTTPDWTQIDPTLKLLNSYGFKAVMAMEFVPYWLEYTSCNKGSHTAPTDINAWAQLTAKVVHHIDTNFPGLVAFYEIWNEPNITLCYPPNNTASGLISEYVAMYGAAAQAMRAQANADAARILIGGPATTDVGTSLSYLQALLNDTTAAPNVDFVTYHRYLAGSNDVTAGELWDQTAASGDRSLYSREQDTNSGVAASYIKIANAARAGQQPNPTQTPILLTEYNDNWSFSNTCCRNDPTYSPLFNSLWVIDQLNTVYSGYNVPALLTYFSAATPAGYFCLAGQIDSAMDCANNNLVTQGYPQYFTYKLIGAGGYLNMNAGGNMAKSVSATSPIAATAFYTSAGDAVLVTNPFSSTLSLTLTLQSAGGSSTTGTMYLLNSSNPGMASSPISFVAGSTGLSATVTLPGYTVLGIKVP
jgi:uncharacterized protein YjdB